MKLIHSPSSRGESSREQPDSLPFTPIVRWNMTVLGLEWGDGLGGGGGGGRGEGGLCPIACLDVAKDIIIQIASPLRAFLSGRRCMLGIAQKATGYVFPGYSGVT